MWDSVFHFTGECHRDEFGLLCIASMLNSERPFEHENDDFYTETGPVTMMLSFPDRSWSLNHNHYSEPSVLTDGNYPRISAAPLECCIT